MVTRPKDLGTWAETQVSRWLAANGHTWAENRRLHGGVDRGDITGLPGICIEVKYCSKTIKLPMWLRETVEETANSNADFGFLVVKPPGVGGRRVDRWWAAMHHGEWSRLLYQVGLIPEEGTVYVLTGGKIAHLPQVMKVSQLALEVPGASVLVTPRGVEDPDQYFRVTTLAGMNHLIRLAGYGDPVEPTQMTKIGDNSTGRGVANEEHDDRDRAGGSVGGRS